MSSLFDPDITTTSSAHTPGEIEVMARVTFMNAIPYDNGIIYVGFTSKGTILSFVFDKECACLNEGHLYDIKGKAYAHDNVDANGILIHVEEVNPV